MSGKDTLGFLTESTILPKAPRPLNATDAAMAPLKEMAKGPKTASSSSTSSTMSGILERLKNKKSAGIASSASSAYQGPQANRGVGERAAADAAVREDDEAKAARASSNLADKARLYSVLSGNATDFEVISFARHLLSLPPSSSFPPSIRMQVKKAAEAAASRLGMDLKGEFAALATISGAKRSRDRASELEQGEEEQEGEEAEDNNDDNHDGGSGVLVDFQYKRVMKEAASKETAAAKRPRLEGNPEAEEPRGNTAQRALPVQFERGRGDHARPGPASASASAPSLAFLAGYEAAKQAKATSGSGNM
jgi:hypothetical protein